MQPVKTRTSIGLEISVLTRRQNQLEAKVDGLEHWSNQATILLDTLGNIMEELKKLEHSR